MCGEYAKFSLWQGAAQRWRPGAPAPLHEVAGRRCSFLRPSCGRRRVLTKIGAYRDVSIITTDMGLAGGSETDVGDRLHLAVMQVLP